MHARALWNRTIGVERGRTMTRLSDLQDLARLSLAETVDALEVLSGGALSTNSEPVISVRSDRVARGQGGARRGAAPAGSAGDRHPAGVAVKHLRNARSAVADSATLPSSYRN
jgi:hypothetical protein